jgi:hypothetical protein
MGSPEHKLVVDDVNTIEEVEEPFVVAQENELIKKLKETMQIPPQGPFGKFDIVWLPHVTSGNGLYPHVEIIVIPWEHVKDFVEEEQNNENFPCKFTRTKNYSRFSTLNSLSHPRANSASLVYR